jgi:hypothetical protein
MLQLGDFDIVTRTLKKINLHLLGFLRTESMPKGLKSKCGSASHQLLKEKAKNRVNDLEGAFSDLQSARKESRANDIAVLEQQVHQMLREWKSELNEPSPASSLVVCSFVHYIYIYIYI